MKGLVLMLQKINSSQSIKSVPNFKGLAYVSRKEIVPKSKDFDEFVKTCTDYMESIKQKENQRIGGSHFIFNQTANFVFKCEKAFDNQFEELTKDFVKENNFELEFMPTLEGHNK